MNNINTMDKVTKIGFMVLIGIAMVGIFVLGWHGTLDGGKILEAIGIILGVPALGTVGHAAITNSNAAAINLVDKTAFVASTIRPALPGPDNTTLPPVLDLPIA